MAKKTNSSTHSSSQNPHARKTTPDPTPSKPSSLSSQSQPLSTSFPHRPNRSKKPTPVAAAAAAAAESSKKFQRVFFTSDDVVLILKSLSDFKSKTGKDPLKHLTALHDSLKSSLSIKTTVRKLREKIRTLKIKFEKLRENSQENINFSCPLEEEAFQLSNKFWGQDNEVEDEDEEKSPEKENAAKNLMLEESPKKENAAKKPSSSKKPVQEEPPKKPKKPSTSKKKPIQEELSSVVDSDKMGRLSLGEMFRFGEMRMDVNVLKRGMELIGESEREELEKRWKKLKIQEAEVFVKRAELAVDQGRLILKELKRSS
ncbi:uncharacterized protein LOC127092376 [Lathyrus oleraceus]|uniref:Glabrous enhancer-binding protein-like DBD domain-containing protein n=1 Tax=Pisum sativum TaxID=3888 RepID=A0A9D4WDM9_PEA|nr:uncharacterized protein LOC127092376 [Pisum sativum]KAI5399807.1 hypothetical protein KIW84_064946 [Pisum sativum]